MTIPCTVKDRELQKFVECPTGSNETAVRTTICQEDGDTINVSLDTSLNDEYDLADGDTSAVKAIYKTLNGVKLAQNNTLINDATVIGITRTGALDGDKIQYQIIGKYTDSTLNFTINSPLYLGIDGNITDVAPSSGFRTQIGTSNGLGEIQINIQEPITL